MIEKNTELKGLAKLFLDSKKVSIVSHKNTDGDALSSMCAISSVLSELGKKPSVFLKDEPAIFGFLSKYLNFAVKNVFESADMIVVVDVSNLDRIDFSEEVKEAKRFGSKIVVLDHHKGGDFKSFADYFYVDTGASATAEIIFELISGMSVDIEKNLATILLSGIIHDTSNFVNQNTTSKTLKIASELISKGARQNIIIENLFRADSVGQLHFWGRAMERIVFIPKFNSMATYITKKDIEECVIESSDAASGTANILNTVKGNPVVFLIAEQDDELKVSMRTRDPMIDLSRLASIFGGGGHPGSAGFTISGKIVENDGDVQII